MRILPIPRGPVQQPLEDRVTQVARQPGPPAPSPYSAHEISKGHPSLAATPPGHASSPGLSQEKNTQPKNAGPATLVYPQAPQTMNSQPQARSPFAAGPRPAHHQFFQRPQIQPPRAAIPNSSPSIRPGAQTPTAVYQANQHIMMVNHLPMPYPVPQGPQYCIPQYRHSGPPYVGPPQQYPVQPPGPGPFYPGPGPGDFANAYASIRIRDPNQGGKDITEEIMSGGGSRNPTPPIGRPASTPTPPQKQEEKPKPDPVFQSPSAVLRLVLSGEKKELAGPMAEPAVGEPAPEPPRTSSPTTLPPLARSSVPSPMALSSQPLFPAEDKCELSSLKEDAPPGPSPASCTAASGPSPSDSNDICKKPCSVAPHESQLIASTILVNEMNGVGEKLPAKENTVDMVRQEVLPLTLQLEVLQHPQEEMEVECTPTPIAPSTLPSISPAPPTPPASPPCPPVVLSAAVARSPAVATEVQRVTEEGESLRTCLSKDAKETQDKAEAESDGQTEETADPQTSHSGRSPAPVQTPTTAPKTWKKTKERTRTPDEVLEAEAEPKAEEELAVDNILEPEQETMSQGCPFERDPSALKRAKAEEENGEEAEPVRNGAESASEGEGGDGNSGSTDSSGDGVTFPFKAESWKPADTEGKKQYDREFLLDIQFMPACIQKPEGLPPISDVVLDKINQPRLPMRTLDPRILPRGPDFTPAFADFGRQTPGGRGVPLLNVGPRRSQPGQRREPRKIITVSVKEDVHLRKAENAWKPSQKRDSHADDPESIKTQELFRKVRSILNKLTPQMFNQLMKQVSALTVDTEERLKGVIDLVFEKAIDEPSFSVAYANMCRCLVTLKVPMADKPGNTVNFRKLLLNRCQKEFEKDKADDDVFEKKQKELEAASAPEERTRLHDELEEAKDKARRRSIGNIKFIGELFKLKMLTEAIMHDCVVKLLKNHDEESLECLCRLLTTIGKDLDFEKAKPRMDQYFNQMEKIVKERKTSSRIRFMLQDVIDLRLCNWVSRRADQGPKTIEQIHKEAKIEEQEEQRKVQQLMTKEKRRPGVQRVDEGGWNTVQGAKNSRVLDPSKFLKITKPTIDEKIQLVPKAQLGSWGKGSSGGAKASETDALRSSASGLNRFSPLQPPAPSGAPSATPLEFDSRRALTSRGSMGREKSDKPLPAGTARPNTFLRGSSKDLLDNQSQEEQRREMLETVKQLTGGVDAERASTEADRSKARELAKSEMCAVPAPDKPALSEEEVERKAKSIIDEFLHINDFKEATQCIEELSAQGPLHVFVKVGVEFTLERSQITRDHMGHLLYQLVQSEKLSKQDFFKGFSETLELADDMAIDIPHIWLYLAELVTPMLKEGGISMRELIVWNSASHCFLLAELGSCFLKSCTFYADKCHKKVGALWREADLSWKDFLPEGEDVHNFLLEQKLDFTESEGPCSSEALSKKELSAEELSQRLEKLIMEDKADDERIFDWVERPQESNANLDESQMSSPTFLRALMTAVCKAAIIADCSTFRVDTAVIKQRVPILLKYLDSDTEKELQALYALQASIVKLDQPATMVVRKLAANEADLLRMFFDCLYDEEVISEDAFYKWESSKDPAEQNGKGVALKSVTAFFTWLREAEEESEDN
ncbi:Eukaryotic translation initiation factor 4 gamma 3 [Apodemus speciosus]|uniref:Eukaryotic translation initiation factor 4 gamma 3 n=1 Tax=Apodemus speciosus TaxID=105296 RepID=A0ABQ0EQ02_APOSI